MTAYTTFNKTMIRVAYRHLLELGIRQGKSFKDAMAWANEVVSETVMEIALASTSQHSYFDQRMELKERDFWDWFAFPSCDANRVPYWEIQDMRKDYLSQRPTRWQKKFGH